MKEKKKSTMRSRYSGFFRVMDGLIISCLLITVVGSALAGASTITILYRSTLVVIILGLASRIIMKSWALWEEMKRGETQANKR